MFEILSNSLAEMHARDFVVMGFVFAVQFLAGLGVGAILWRPRRSDDRPVQTVLRKP
jgi:hypothetical protein